SIAMAGIAIGQNLNQDIEKGVFDRFRSLPIARSAPLVGIVLADFVRYLVLFAITLGFGMLLGFSVQTDPLSVLAALGISMAFGLCFSWVSVFVGMKARTSGAVQGIMFLLVLPLSFASSTFVAPSTMPGWLESFVNVNPITHLVDTVRGLMVGGPVATPLLWTLLWMGILLVVFVPLALRAYKRRA
ncbi:MAG: ABC transporter permease, partial [Nocardioidaceae bacterium]